MYLPPCRGGWILCIARFSHTVADTPEFLRSCVDRLEDRDTPSQNEVCTRSSHCQTAADTPESLPLCLGRLGDRDAPCENQVCTGSGHSNTVLPGPLEE